MEADSFICGRSERRLGGSDGAAVASAGLSGHFLLSVADPPDFAGDRGV